VKHRILVVDDDPGVARVLELLITETGNDATVVDSVPEAKTALADTDWSMVITDLRLPGGDGLDVLAAARAAMPDTPVLMITAYATVETAVRALKSGAFDYLVKPFENDRLKALVATALSLRDLRAENVRLRSEVEQRYGLGAIVGASASMQRVRELARLAAGTDTAVMVLGETGTGKELVARAIHLLSSRSSRPFVAVNCGAIPDTLVESELFGHRKGSFTGATADRDGRFVQADTGTIFLDEVTEMKRDLQVKLLRAIEAKEIQPVGATETVHVDVRVISATNRNPRQSVEQGTLREDLYYRLNVFTINLPPLRDHPEDIPDIAAAFLSHRGYGPDAVSRDALELLAGHDFPGNVRELQNVIESGLILSQGREVRPEHIADRLMPRPPGSDRTDPAERSDLPRLADVERGHLEAALRKAGGNQSQAARLLGISRATLLYRIKKHGLS
jgi:DNA-binding NtrC family response regulator